METCLEAVRAWKEWGCTRCLATAVSWDMGLWRVCVCTNANLGTPSIIQQILSFAALNFSWFFLFLKLLYARFKKMCLSNFANDILWKWCLLYISGFGQGLSFQIQIWHQDSYSAVIDQSVCGMGKKRAVNKGELCSQERKKKMTCPSGIKDWRRGSKRVPYGKEAEEKDRVKGNK